MALDDTIFTKQELQSFDVHQLKRISEYLSITIGSKDKKALIVEKIWNVIKPKPVQSGNAIIDGVEVPVTVRLKLIQESIEREKI